MNLAKNRKSISLSLYLFTFSQAMLPAETFLIPVLAGR